VQELHLKPEPVTDKNVLYLQQLQPQLPDQPQLSLQPLREEDLNPGERGSIVLHVAVFSQLMLQIVEPSMLVIHLKEKLVTLVMFVCGILIWNQPMTEQQSENVIPQESFWEV